MSRLHYLALAALIALSAFAHADDWSKTFALTGRPELRINTGDANIRVEPWEKSSIEVHVTTVDWKIGDHGIKIQDHQDGNRVELDVHPQPRHVHVSVTFGSREHRRIDVQVQMPREGKLDFTTGDGRVSIRHMKGEFTVRTGDGTQEIEDVDGTLDARSGDGRIEAAGRFDRLSLTSGDGRIRANISTGSKISSTWYMKAGDGSIELRLPEKFPADLELRTGDGHIDLEMPVEVAGEIPRKSLHGKVDGGGGLVSIRTTDGSIRLGRL